MMRRSGGLIARTRTLESARELGELESMLAGEGVKLCTAPAHAHRAEHPAAWHAGCPCGHVLAVCEQLHVIARGADGWRCTPRPGSGCTGWHTYDRITWTRA
jgi:hypothetical protein